MKKIVFFLVLVVSFCFPVMPVFAVDHQYDKAGMASASVNAVNGQFLAGQNQDVILPLASLTKLMTALVLLDLKLDFNKKVIITEKEINYVNAYIEEGDITSKINLKAGDKVLVKDLWHAMLIASSNEAAVALVDNSGLTRAQFIARMNSKAKIFGLKKTKFTEMSGIDPKNIGTAKEMAIIAWRAYRNLTIRRAGILDSYQFKDLKTDRAISVYNRNTSLMAMEPLAMKVGYLTEAKNNCAIRLQSKGKDRVIVILHAINNQRRNSEISRLLIKK